TSKIFAPFYIEPHQDFVDWLHIKEAFKMSTDSPKRLSKCAGSVVRPQAVSDKSYMASVVDFLHDAYAATQQQKEEKEQVVWIRFENTAGTGITCSSDYIETDSVDPPLLLFVGYTNGMQIWTIPVSGEAQEVLSVRQGPIRIAKLLSAPKSEITDPLQEKRPLMVMCDGAGSSHPFCSYSVLSLKTGEVVHTKSFKTPIVDLLCNNEVLVVALQEKVAVFNSCTFQVKFYIIGCYPAPLPNLNPLALGSRWLAYADKKLVSVHQSGGGMSGDGVHSYAATVINAAKTITKGLSIFGETVGRLASGKDQRSGSPTHSPTASAASSGAHDKIPGIVTIIDTNLIEGELDVNEESNGEGIVAHFPAHANEPVSAMEFDPSGTLLVTAGTSGHNFHLFRILPHPWQSSQAAVHHLYILHRGDTSAKVQDISFTLDSRWVSISTLRGTAHVFPITTYGGPIGARTHTSPKVVNKESRFHRSAGLEDIALHRQCSGHSSTHKLSGSPTSGFHGEDNVHAVTASSLVQHGNPRLPPYPHQSPRWRQQLKQLNPLVTMTTSTTTKPKLTSPQATATDSGYFPMASCFAPSRALAFSGSPKVNRDKSESVKPPVVDSLYVMGCHGKLVEYFLEPHAPSGLTKKSDDAPLEVTTSAKLQWLLQRSPTAPEYRPPLGINNPLIQLTCEQPNTDYYFSDDTQLELDMDDGFRGEDEDWLPEVEMLTHAGPHRRLWMGPQFQFKTFNSAVSTTVLSSQSSALLSQSPETTGMDLYNDELDFQSLRIHPVRSQPVPTPHVGRSDDSAATSMPTLIEAGSGSFDQSSTLLEVCGSWPESGRLNSNEQVEEQLKQTLAEAMLESPMKESHSTTLTGGQQDVHEDCVDHYSTSSSSGSVENTHHYMATASPPHNIEHVLVFPSNSSNSPESF
ncbi:LOW QUALITY PROTEIN: BCAS3 microtubule associated cell migration factor-like, partial [Ptychodera flava]|uniref:LOW QUALITY PROTEIN: BCAS3 microtubule associated cell migration factor-like n=1 Tax=Ptychodera flava TaxID=63121 RepID=UPI00396A4B72